MNISVYLVIILGVFCGADATFFGLGRKGNKVIRGYLSDLGGAVLRYAPGFSDVLPKVSKFFGVPKHHHKHKDEYGYDGGHHHGHHQHTGEHHHKGHHGSAEYYGLPYYGVSPYTYGSSPYDFGSPHFDFADFYAEPYGFNEVYPGLHHYDHGFDHFHGINHLDFW